jgi:hypothetical protein
MHCIESGGGWQETAWSCQAYSALDDVQVCDGYNRCLKCKLHPLCMEASCPLTVSTIYCPYLLKVSYNFYAWNPLLTESGYVP